MRFAQLAIPVLALAAFGVARPPPSPASPPPHLPTPAPAELIARRLGGSSMAHMALLTTPDGRALLGHAVACALPRGAAFTAIDRDGQPFTFAGALGLAPAWAARATTLNERARLDLCLRSLGHGPIET